MSPGVCDVRLFSLCQSCAKSLAFGSTYLTAAVYSLTPLSGGALFLYEEHEHKIFSGRDGATNLLTPCAVVDRLKNAPTACYIARSVLCPEYLERLSASARHHGRNEIVVPCEFRSPLEWTRAGNR